MRPTHWLTAEHLGQPWSHPPLLPAHLLSELHTGLAQTPPPGSSLRCLSTQVDVGRKEPALFKHTWRNVFVIIVIISTHTRKPGLWSLGRDGGRAASHSALSDHRLLGAPAVATQLS